MTRTVYISKDDEMLDEILWRQLGDQQSHIDSILEANPGIADYGPRLPAGVVIQLLDANEISQPTQGLRLWD